MEPGHDLPGMSDYMVIQVIVLALLLLYPQIALWLPSVVR